MQLGLWMMLSALASERPGITIGGPDDRPDRMITISGTRAQELVAEYSADGGATWHPATIYVGTTIDEWRPCNYAVWNKGALEGRIPAGDKDCLWNYFFDVGVPADSVALRLRKPGGEVVMKRTIDLSGAKGVFVIDRRNAAALAGGELPAPWNLSAAGKKHPAVDSITCPADDPAAPPIVLKPNLKGWHRIYIGMEPFSAFEFSLSGEDIQYATPDYLASPHPRGQDRFLQEFYLKSADLTDQDVCLAVGGSRDARRDASVRHVRFVPMTPGEVAHHKAFALWPSPKAAPSWATWSR